MAALHEAGFREEDDGTAVGQTKPATEDAGVRAESGVTMGTGAGVGLLAGAALGGLAAAALPGMLIVGAAGALLGGLIDLGVPEGATGFYDSQWKAGRPLVVVRAAGRPDEAAELLRRQGAEDVRSSPAPDRPATF